MNARNEADWDFCSLVLVSEFDIRASELSSYQVDLFPFRERHDGFLPVRASSQWTTHTLLFSGVITGVHINYLLLKQPFNRVFDLNFVRARTHAKDILILLFTHQRRLFR